MKILAIMGSPHGMQGNAGRLLENVLAGVEHSGGEVELLSLSKSKVLPCVSCEVCNTTGQNGMWAKSQEGQRRAL